MNKANKLLNIIKEDDQEDIKAKIRSRHKILDKEYDQITKEKRRLIDKNGGSIQAGSSAGIEYTKLNKRQDDLFKDFNDFVKSLPKLDGEKTLGYPNVIDNEEISYKSHKINILSVLSPSSYPFQSTNPVRTEMVLDGEVLFGNMGIDYIKKYIDAE